MRYYVRMDKLKEEGEKLKKFGREEVDSKVDHLMKVKDDIGWSSPAGTEFNDIYQEMVDKLYDLGGIIEKLGTFMEYCSEHYGEANDKVIADWEILLEEIEEKRLKRLAEENIIDKPNV